MMRTFFNRPIFMGFLMLVAGFTYFYISTDGFQKRHIYIPALADDVEFLESRSRQAFYSQSEEWLLRSGYERSDLSWKEVTGKAAASQSTGVREDLTVYVRRLSRRSYQAWGLAPPTENMRLVQVYRAMFVSEWSQEKADEFRDVFEQDALRIKNLANLGRSL